MSSYNQRRVEDGFRTMLAYQTVCRSEPDAIREKEDEQYIDCITDILHCANAQGLDVEAIIRMAQEHFTQENNDPDLNKEDSDNA